MMKEFPVFSIIVPFYNAESYIEQCADSLFNQTLRDRVEWIFVNDASTDSSMVRLSGLVEKQNNDCKSRIHIISHKNNLGVAEARKEGFEKSKGRYVMFCDADDWLELDACEILYGELMREESDVIVFDYVHEYKFYSCPAEEKTGSNREAMLKDIVSGRVSGSLWYRVIKADLLRKNNLILPVGSMIEDLIVCVQVMWLANSVRVINDRLYHYRHNNNSTTHNTSEPKVMERYETYLKNIELLCGILKNLGHENECRDGIIMRKYMAKQILNPCLHKPRIRKKWLSTYPEINGLILKSKLFSLKQKILYLMIKWRLHPVFPALKSLKARIGLS